jgi:hypothetical protein
LKRFSTILFFSITLLAQTEFHQILKLPSFIEHFTEHKIENSTISIIEFVLMHYFNGNIKDKDYEKDMKLPFKTTECAALAAHIDIIPTHSFTTAQPVLFINKTYPSLTNSKVRFNQSGYIWHPPKFA